MKNSIRLLLMFDYLLIVLAACNKPGETGVKDEQEKEHREGRCI